ncbi:MAG: PfkB family carbohydrate kinase [Pseudomonadota bacterium]
MIVACGEALVDLMPEVAGDGSALYRPVLGGSLFNVAMGIARLGGEAGYLWELSTDAFGDQLVQALVEDGVDVSCVRRTSRMTPVAVVDMSGSEPAYNIADADGVMREMAFAQIPDGATVLHIGSAVLAREPIASAIEGVAVRAPLVSLDYNVRPPSIEDVDIYRARLMRLSKAAGLVKASSADIELLGIDDHDSFAAEILAGGAALVVLTMGEDGAQAWSASGGRCHMASQVSRLVDPVGAGDGFMAGMLAHLQKHNLLTRRRLSDLSGASLQATLAAGQRGAALVCATQGAMMPKLGVSEPY